MMSSSVPSSPCWPRKACWPTWWNRTSPCGGAKGSASAGSTSSGSPTGGNARALTRPSASEDCRPVLCSPLLPHGPHQGPFPAPLPLFPVLLNSSSQRAQLREWDPGWIPCIVPQGLAGPLSPIVLWKQQLELGRSEVLQLPPQPAVEWQDLAFCLGSRVYILPTETSIFLGSNPSCHHCVDIASFLTAFFPTVVILVGPGPCVMLES